MDKYNIDSHKLMYHPRRVADFLLGRHIYPIYIEVSPTAICNHRCVFCALDFMGHKNQSLDLENYKEFIYKSALLDIKSVMFGGEGEPLLYQNIVDMIVYTYTRGVSTAITTNGVLLDYKISKSILPFTHWIKISVDAGSSGLYQKIHGAGERDWDKLLTNIIDVVKEKRDKKLKTSIGVQFLLLQENIHETHGFIRIMKNIGVDYIVIKPYSQMSQSKNKIRIDYMDMNYGLGELWAQYCDDDKVIIRMNALNKASQKRPYEICRALPFWSYVSSNGDVWNCSAHIGEEEFLRGNINFHSPEVIFRRNKTHKALECRVNCRMDECNRYLERLVNPKSHDNFI